MIDVHSQLHLRTQAIDAFHLFLWRHILSKPIANLDGLARAVKPDMITIPDDLLNPIVTFLNGCGDIIWPSLAASRHHLLKTSRSLQYGYWTSHDSSGTSTGPVWLRDGFMTPNVRRQWEQNTDGSEPPSDVNVINSALGRLIKIYVFAMLQHSLVNPFGYRAAARVESAEMLGQILEVDQNEVQKGPIGEAMRLNRDKSSKTVEEMVLQYREQTGYKGGLS
ncbi:hypothetical protein PRZ48_009515 [Zasmidium cellare]|uniref:Uncharacterized protein n=1 Tax=Zasmidium cellare TaxID=395010 RepID=A0ABR0ECZ7_ZASCE|nr:hypothetical protein PRZ48_009515 [Zasmidium cellare]